MRFFKPAYGDAAAFVADVAVAVEVGSAAWFAGTITQALVARRSTASDVAPAGRERARRG